MKPFIVVTLCSMLSAPMLFSQTGSINNTLGLSGMFTIKDGSTTFLTLSQSDGYLGLSRSLTMPVTAVSGLGVIYKGSDRFIHDYKASGADGYNTFVGINSGNFGMIGTGSLASSNTAVGHSSLTSLTTGHTNSAFGAKSLYYNTDGWANCAFGYYSLYSNAGIGSYNSAFGYSSLDGNTSGISNSAFGQGAGFNITTGSNNTCIGSGAQVPNGTSDNQVRIGNTSVTYAGVQVAWTVSSDSRWKSNIVQSDLGLDFVSRLNPVSYTRKNDDKQRAEYGFIAQEIEEVLKEAGVGNTGMLTIDDAGMYQLRYNDLLAPMVKAIQELKNENDALKNRLSKSESVQELLVNEIERLKSEGGRTLSQVPNKN